MDIEKYFKEYGFRSRSTTDEKVEGVENIEVKEVAKNEDGLILLEFDSTLCDTMVSYETVEELFPNYNFDINKGYLFKLNNILYFE